MSGNNSANGGCGGCGCFSVTGLIIFLIVVLFSSPDEGTSSDGSIKSTIERTPLDSSKVVKENYFYHDGLDWIDDEKTLSTGMSSFYAKTGVSPFLAIQDNIRGNSAPTQQQALAYMQEAYDYMFEDEGHMIVLFLEAKNDHSVWIYCGEDAATVIDYEAKNILLSNIEHEYYSDNTDAEVFSKAFADTAKQIME